MTSSKMPAPDFNLQGPTQQVNLSQLKGTPSILVFYPADNTSVCSSQLALYNEILPMFEEHHAKIVGISVDDMATHDKFAKKLDLHFPLLSDDKPLGEVSEKFQVFDKKAKRSRRALFVLDKDGNIHWSQIVPYEVNPGAEGILKALEELSNTNSQ